MTTVNFREITTIYLTSSVASLTAGTVAGVLWDHLGGSTDYTVTVLGTWFVVVGVPSCLISGDTLRRKLGQIRPNTVTARGRGRSGRAIPLTANGKTGHLFLSQIPWLAVPDQTPVPDVYTATLSGTPYEVTRSELETFLYGVWRRQRAGEPYPLSRPYWTRQAKPRLKTGGYNARLAILSSLPGLILDRSKRRSGRLGGSPQYILDQLQNI